MIWFYLLNDPLLEDLFKIVKQETVVSPSLFNPLYLPQQSPDSRSVKQTLLKKGQMTIEFCVHRHYMHNRLN